MPTPIRMTGNICFAFIRGLPPEYQFSASHQVFGGIHGRANTLAVAANNRDDAFQDFLRHRINSIVYREEVFRHAKHFQQQYVRGIFLVPFLFVFSILSCAEISYASAKNVFGHSPDNNRLFAFCFAKNLNDNILCIYSNAHLPLQGAYKTQIAEAVVYIYCMFFPCLHLKTEPSLRQNRRLLPTPPGCWNAGHRLRRDRRRVRA